MTQVTDAISWSDCKVEISTDNVNFTDLSGESNKMTQSGGEIAVGEQTTNEGEMPIVTYGKRGRITLTLAQVYRKTAGSAWRIARDAYKNKTVVYLRWSPEGGKTGDLRFYTGPCRVLSPTLPVGDSADPKALLVEIQFSTNTVDDVVIT